MESEISSKSSEHYVQFFYFGIILIQMRLGRSSFCSIFHDVLFTFQNGVVLANQRFSIFSWYPAEELISAAWGSRFYKVIPYWNPVSLPNSWNAVEQAVHLMKIKAALKV